MNRSAYMTAGLAMKALAALSRTRVRLHGAEQVPPGGAIFVTNRFTRLDMLLTSYHLFQLTGRPVWSLAEAGEFKGALEAFLNRHGGQSDEAPDRDRLMVKTLLTGEASWIFFLPRRIGRTVRRLLPPWLCAPSSIAGGFARCTG
jgi:hypothetical protein